MIITVVWIALADPRKLLNRLGIGAAAKRENAEGGPKREILRCQAKRRQELLFRLFLARKSAECGPQVREDLDAVRIDFLGCFELDQCEVMLTQAVQQRA